MAILLYQRKMEEYMQQLEVNLITMKQLKR